MNMSPMHIKNIRIQKRIWAHRQNEYVDTSTVIVYEIVKKKSTVFIEIQATNIGQLDINFILFIFGQL